MLIYVLLLVTVILFASRIRDTPAAIDKKKWDEKMQRTIDNFEITLSNTSKEVNSITRNVVQTVAVTMSIGLSILCAIYYVIVARTVNEELLIVLSFLQICTIIYGITLQTFIDKCYIMTLEHQVFHKWFNLFNVILDYVYYPITFVMLIWCL